jgi:hypothetical protein
MPAVELGKEFRPAGQMKQLYYAYLTLFILVGVLTWFVPVLIFAPVEVSVFLVVLVLAVILSVVFWIPRYYESIRYLLDESEVEWRRGVWFRNTGVVPYNRITNVDTSQGPLSRSLDIASLKIQTAGYSGQASGLGKPSEISINGIQDFEGLREQILNKVRMRRPTAVETFEEDTDSRILEELVRIRELLKRSLDSHE